MPKCKNNTQTIKKTKEDKNTGSKNRSVWKKRTNSAPDKKPAPMLVPIINMAPRKLPIRIALPPLSFYEKKCKIMSDIVIERLTNYVEYCKIKKMEAFAWKTRIKP